MTARRHIDVTTGDYELVAGRHRPSQGVASSVVLALRMRRGTCAVAPELGSRLHTIRKLSSDAPRLAQDYAREALQHLVDRGDLRDLVLQAEAEGTALALTVAYQDRTGERRTLEFTTTVG